MTKRTHIPRALVLTMMLALCMFLPWGAARAQAPTPAPSPAGPLMDTQVTEALRRGRLLLNFENIDIRVLARMMAELTGRNIVLDDRVQGRVTILSAREVTPAEAWDIFTTALQRYGFSVVDRGEYVQVLPSVEARRTSRIITPGTAPVRSEDLVMAILILQRANPDIVQNAVRPLISEVGFLLPYKEGNALIVAERAAVVSRIAEIVRTLDRLHPAAHTSIVFPKYIEAERVVPVLQQLFQGQADFRVMAFGPANAIVITGSAAQILEVKRTIERLDVPEAAPTRIEPPRFFVYNLQFAQAEDVAKILSEMLQERQRAQQQEQQQPQLPATQVNVNPALPNGVNPPSMTTAATDQPIVPANAVDVRPAGPVGPTGRPSEPAKVQGFVSSRVSADPETNSLVLYISPSEYEDLRPVIARLDLERRQVQISAVVAEVSLRRVNEMGVNWQAVTDGGIIGSFGGGLTEETLLSLLANGQFIIGGSGANTKTINVNGRNVNVPEFFVALSMLQDDSDFNLISAPRVLTQDHKEAVMNVGQVVPFATGGRLDAFGQPLVTFDYREVGIKLEVTPHVSQSGKIRMEINQEIQEVTDFLRQDLGGAGFSAPIISNRNVKTTVTIGNGETLLIGGLVSKRTVDAVRGVPILKDLPLIGALFRNTNRDEQKTSVFISITPQIVATDTDLPRLDQHYEPFLEDVPNPGDQQPEDRETYPPGSAMPPAKPDQLVPGAGGSGTGARPAPNVYLQGFGFPKDVGPGKLSRPVVTARNQTGRPVEVVLLGSVQRPDGKTDRLETAKLTLGIGEERQVPLPHYSFPEQGGVYQFDVVAQFDGHEVGRLPNPWRLELPEPGAPMPTEVQR